MYLYIKYFILFLFYMLVTTLLFESMGGNRTPRLRSKFVINKALSITSSFPQGFGGVSNMLRAVTNRLVQKLSSSAVNYTRDWLSGLCSLVFSQFLEQIWLYLTKYKGSLQVHNTLVELSDDNRFIEYNTVQCNYRCQASR